MLSIEGLTITLISCFVLGGCGAASSIITSTWDYDRANAECHRLGTGVSHPAYRECMAGFGFDVPKPAVGPTSVDAVQVGITEDPAPSDTAGGA